MERIQYSSPQESIEEDKIPQHRFDLVVDGRCVGAAEVDYYSKPLPLYQVTDLYVDFEYQGKGYASQIMDRVENWLREKKKPGILVEAIFGDHPASGMYERRSWRPVPNSFGQHVYNWPDDVDLSILNGYPQRYTNHLDRDNNKV